MQFIKFTLVLILFSLSFQAFSQTKAQVQQIIKNYDLEEIAKMASETEELQNKQLAKARELASINNWPLTFVDENGSYHALMRVTDDNKPVYYKTSNVNAAKSSRAKWLHNGGGLGLNIEGQDMTVHVWDGGLARATHNEFTDGGGSPTRIVAGDPGEPTHEHATHVTGTIIAYGSSASAKGMAPKATAISYDWFGDLTEVTIESSNGMLISNHSYGPALEDLADWEIGAYTMSSRTWDKIMYNAPYYLMVSAAGNDGNDNTSNGEPLDGNSSYDKLDPDSTNKNGLVVANGFDLSINSNGEVVGSINLDSSSSEGPTDDYRVKPDITGNGTAVYSCTDASDNSYASWYGTSMASPNVAGSILLLQQLYNQVNSSFMLSSTARGLALHNADDGGMVGPDSRYGWGYMNTKKAAECILNNGSTAEVREFVLEEGGTYSIQVTSDNTNPLLASICWTDKHSNNINTGTANLFLPPLESDLDLRLTKGGTTYEPWKLTGVATNAKGDNIVDNFERVDINGASGTYTLTITHKGSLADSQQKYSLILTGITSTNIGVDSNEIMNYKIWPNPNKGIFNIFVEGEGEVFVTISNILGKIIHKTNYTNTSSFVKNINLNNIAKGMYLVSVVKNGKKSTNKLIIE